MRFLNTSEERITNINIMKDNLVSGGHGERKIIEKKCAEVNHMWSETKELAQARAEVCALFFPTGWKWILFLLRC